MLEISTRVLTIFPRVSLDLYVSTCGARIDEAKLSLAWSPFEALFLNNMDVFFILTSEYDNTSFYICQGSSVELYWARSPHPATIGAELGSQPALTL